MSSRPNRMARSEGRSVTVTPHVAERTRDGTIAVRRCSIHATHSPMDVHVMSRRRSSAAACRRDGLTGAQRAHVARNSRKLDGNGRGARSACARDASRPASDAVRDLIQTHPLANPRRLPAACHSGTVAGLRPKMHHNSPRPSRIARPSSLDSNECEQRVAGRPVMPCASDKAWLTAAIRCRNAKRAAHGGRPDLCWRCSVGRSDGRPTAAINTDSDSACTAPRPARRCSQPVRWSVSSAARRACPGAGGRPSSSSFLGRV